MAVPIRGTGNTVRCGKCGRDIPAKRYVFHYTLCKGK